jgi:hypothetical protein
MAEEVMRRYRGRVLYGPFASLDPGDMQALEAETGYPVPVAYRAFLEVAHGGSLDYSVRVPPGPDGEIIAFSDLYRAGRDDRGEYGFGTLTGEYRQWAKIIGAGRALLPIAHNGGGDTLFLELDGQSPGRVIAFIHGLPSWTGLTGQDTVAVVGDSFDAYLDSLFISEDIAEMAWEDAQNIDSSDPWHDAVEAWLNEGLPGWRERPWALRYAACDRARPTRR